MNLNRRCHRTLAIIVAVMIPAGLSAAEIPTEQADMVSVAQRYADYYDTQSDGPEQEKMRVDRNDEICAAVSPLRAAYWIGRVYRIWSAPGDRAGFVVNIGGEGKDLVLITTAVNPYRDPYHTLILSTDPLYDALQTLHENDVVRFSGTFFADQKDCIVSETGGMKSPDFLIRFTDLEKLEQ
jgi:hypothetical protein